MMARHRRDDGGRQGDPMLEGQDPAQEHGDLPGEHEPHEGRSLQGRQGEHDGQGRPSVQGQDPVPAISPSAIGPPWHR